MNFGIKRICLALLILVISLSGCSSETNIEGETVNFTDSCGRNVEIPEEITRVAPSGSTASLIIMTLAPEKLVGLSSTPSKAQMKYFPEEVWTLPTFGQFYGSKATLNMESLIAADPQIIIDLGDKKNGHKQDMNSIQKQTGIPTIFIEADIDTFPEAYRTLGKVLGMEDEAEERAQFIEEALSYAKECSAKIPEDERKSVYYGTGVSGLDCNAAGSVQQDVIDIVGGENAIKVPENEITNSGGGTLINLEELYNSNPDVIILTDNGPYDDISKKSFGWSKLKAVVNDEYYEIPCEPYCWMSGPPSVNRIIGIYWLGNLLYPDVYTCDVVEKAQEFYSLFYNYDLSREEAEEMLSKSTLK